MLASFAAFLESLPATPSRFRLKCGQASSIWSARRMRNGGWSRLWQFDCGGRVRVFEMGPGGGIEAGRSIY
jgi:hypothetical protein